jgi:predicted nuclease of predicted toxin-antitoxin system
LTGIVPFLIDAQLPPALARALNAAGHPSQHVATIGLLKSEDDAIWQYAMANRLVVLTKHEDFVIRRLLEADGPQIVWLRVGSCSNRQLLAWFLPLLADIVARLQQRENVVEVI